VTAAIAHLTPSEQLRDVKLPSIRRHLSDSVDTINEKLPEPLWAVHAARGAAAHPDNRDWLVACPLDGFEFRLKVHHQQRQARRRKSADPLE
jgi:hypothetical protein